MNVKQKKYYLAMRLEQFMNKEEILEAYLNIIPYGRNSMEVILQGLKQLLKEYSM